MATITEDYISFEAAKLLKEKGFDVPCVYVYRHDHSEDIWDTDKEDIACQKPTLQMAMKWLREVHKLHIEVYIIKSYSNKTVEYCITIEDLNFPGNNDGFHITPHYKSYEEACEVAIKYCLENLV